MELGIHFVDFTSPPGGADALGTAVADTATTAEEVGCTTFTVMDHWFQMESLATAADPMLECYTTLGFVAGQTRRIQLGALVTGVTYRNPGLLAKIVTTLDVLSGGRAFLGIGAAWYEREHLGLGVAFPPVAERFERLDETLRIVRQMWSDDDGPFEGHHFRLAETICVPRPLRRPGPPILIGGSGEHKTLRLVARYADACNLFATDAETLRHKIGVLHERCREIGRDPAEVRITILGGGDPFGDPEGFVRAMAEVAPLSVDLVEVMPMGGDPVAQVAGLADRVVRQLAELGPA